MINFIQKTLCALAVVAVMLPSFALAAVLDVTFQATPLFLNANVVPGDDESRTVTVTNTGTDTENVYTSVENTFSNGLAGVMQLAVSDGVTAYFTGSFSDFFTASPIALGTLAGGEHRTYTFTASLATGIGNDYQTKTFGFDLIMGFEGGESITDGVGGDGGGRYLFTIFNELVAGVDTDAHSATLSWNTNHNGSTYIVCGNMNDGSFTLDPEAPLFGYTFDVSEVAVDDVVHTVTLTDLDFGDYECRPVSRPNPSAAFTVGDTLHFSLTPDGIVLGDSTINPAALPFVSYTTTAGSPISPTTGSILSMATTNASSTTLDGDVLGITRTQADKTPVSDVCKLWWLILLVVISFSWSVIEDLLRATRSYFNLLFFRNTIFSIVYMIALYLGYSYDLLQQYWWVLAGAWMVMTVIDYSSHRAEFPDWSAVPHNLFYSAAGLIFLLTSYFFALPCVWWPFALIAATSFGLFIFEKLGQTTTTTPK